MKKPWSITTTLRNPERLRNFLIVLQKLKNLEWTSENQKKYQILLIQNRVYGFGNPQFYKGLSQKQINLIDDSSKEEYLTYISDISEPLLPWEKKKNRLKSL